MCGIAKGGRHVLIVFDGTCVNKLIEFSNMNIFRPVSGVKIFRHV